MKPNIENLIQAINLASHEQKEVIVKVSDLILLKEAIEFLQEHIEVLRKEIATTNAKLILAKIDKSMRLSFYMDTKA
jgi:ribosomal protein S15P/S13E